MKLARGRASKEASLARAIRDYPTLGWARWESAEAELAVEGIETPVHQQRMIKRSRWPLTFLSQGAPLSPENSWTRILELGTLDTTNKNRWILLGYNHTDPWLG